MANGQESATNQKKLPQVYAAWQELLDQVLRRGFFGTATLEVYVHDGAIQQIKRKTERVEK
jgi:hypothetical protein